MSSVQSIHIFFQRLLKEPEEVKTPFRSRFRPRRSPCPGSRSTPLGRRPQRQRRHGAAPSRRTASRLELKLCSSPKAAKGGRASPELSRFRFRFRSRPENPTRTADLKEGPGIRRQSQSRSTGRAELAVGN